MKINFKKFYQGFISTFFVLIVLYIIFSSSFSIFYPSQDLKLINIILHLIYLFLLSFVFLIFLGILIQILLDLKDVRKIPQYQWKTILFTNTFIIFIWFLNILVYIFYFVYYHAPLIIEMNSLYQDIYSNLLILIYTFFIILSITFIIGLILFHIYISCLQSINGVVFFYHDGIFKELIENDKNEESSTFLKLLEQILTFSFEKKILETGNMINNIRITELLIQAKKERTPPRTLPN